MDSRFTVSARLYSVRVLRASSSPCFSQRFHSLTASAPSTPLMSSSLVIPRETSRGFSPPRYPTFLDAKRRSYWGMSRSTVGKLFLSTGTSKQLPLNVTSMLAPSSASDRVSGSRSMPWVSVMVSFLEWTVTTVTSESRLSPSVSMSRYLASSPKSPKSRQCSPLGVISARDPQSRSSRSSCACMRTASSRAFASGFIVSTLSAERKSSHVRTPEPHMACSFFAPTDGRSTNVFDITAAVKALLFENVIPAASADRCKSAVPHRPHMTDAGACIEEAFIRLRREGRRVSVTDVCDAAGVSRNTFYEHYRGLADLGHSISRRTIDGLREEVAPYVNRRSDEFDVCSYLDTALAYIDRHRDVFEAFAAGNGDEEFMRIWRDGILSDIRRVLPDGTDRMVTEMAAYAAVGGLTYMVRNRAYDRRDTLIRAMGAFIEGIPVEGCTPERSVMQVL